MGKSVRQSAKKTEPKAKSPKGNLSKLNPGLRSYLEKKKASKAGK